MLDVRESARRLGVSEARVRTMLKDGVLEGVKIGRTWAVSERSVAQRTRDGAHPGRPSKRQAPYKPAMPDVDAAHRIYDEAQRVLAGCYDADFLKLARTPEEREFWVCTADCFLQQQQRSLIEAGVF